MGNTPPASPQPPLDAADYVVVGRIRGAWGIRGEVKVDGGQYPLGVGDVVYVAPSEPHQFLNPEDADEPFGFYCIVNAVRDRPVPVNAAEHVCAICE